MFELQFITFTKEARKKNPKFKIFTTNLTPKPLRLCAFARVLFYKNFARISSILISIPIFHPKKVRFSGPQISQKVNLFQ